jgi:hypothetical protein
MSDLKQAPKATSKYDAWAYVLIGIFGIPLLALGVGALVLPPGLSFSLVSRGLKEGKLSWVLLGGLTGLLWVVFLWATGRKIMRGKPEETPREETPTA